LLLTELTNSHVFKSGNKRTAFSATVTFLETNGKNVPVSESPKVMQGIREGFYTQEEIEKWLRHGQIREFSRSP
jgi:death-on-curing family protein